MKFRNLILSIGLGIMALYYYIISKATLVNIILLGITIFLIVAFIIFLKSIKRKAEQKRQEKQLKRIEETEKAKELGKLKARIELGIETKN